MYIYKKLIILRDRIFFEKRQHYFAVSEKMFKRFTIFKCQEKDQCYKWMLVLFFNPSHHRINFEYISVCCSSLQNQTFSPDDS